MKNMIFSIIDYFPKSYCVCFFIFSSGGLRSTEEASDFRTVLMASVGPIASSSPEELPAPVLQATPITLAEVMF